MVVDMPERDSVGVVVVAVKVVVGRVDIDILVVEVEAEMVGCMVGMAVVVAVVGNLYRIVNMIQIIVSEERKYQYIYPFLYQYESAWSSWESSTYLGEHHRRVVEVDSL